MRQKYSGIFITFEGTEGAGKSTLIREVARQLTERLGPSTSPSITVTREPGGSPIAEKIRQLILESHPGETMDPWTELFLYESARAQHLARIIRPALEKGGVVLCDRYTDSTLAYQGHARGLPWKSIQLLNRVATQGVTPNLTVLLDIDPAVGLERAREKNRFELEGVNFQRKVRAGFLKARREQPRRWLTIASQKGTPEQNAKRLVELLLSKFKKRLQPGSRGSRA